MVNSNSLLVSPSRTSHNKTSKMRAAPPRLSIPKQPKKKYRFSPPIGRKIRANSVLLKHLTKIEMIEITLFKMSKCKFLELATKKIIRIICRQYHTYLTKECSRSSSREIMPHHSYPTRIGQRLVLPIVSKSFKIHQTKKGICLYWLRLMKSRNLSEKTLATTPLVAHLIKSTLGGKKVLIEGKFCRPLKKTLENIKSSSLLSTNKKLTFWDSQCLLYNRGLSILMRIFKI